MSRNIAVTSALPYANGPIHIGHLVEYIQTDIWSRYQKLSGNNCLYFCADDTHGTPIMIRANKEGITPEELINGVHAEHYADFKDFFVNFDNYYTTHSPENRDLSAMIYNRLKDKGSISTREVEQTYCSSCDMWLPDRFVKGTCPKCKSPDQYGDSCDSCGATYQPTDVIEPKCSICGKEPVRRNSEHYFFKLADYEEPLRKLLHDEGHTHDSVANKLDEWFKTGLKDWDISRDGPYFGFNIPGEENKFFYVWLDAPVGYMASAKNYCEKNGLDFDKIWGSDEWELYHFIGKDIMYFHALFWPAMLMGAGLRTANKLFVHGFLTVNGQKMSKSKGTFIKARTYLNHLNPEYLRYYYASKLSSGVDDIDLSLEDFINKVNSDLVGKLANLTSRTVPMLNKKLDAKLGKLDDEGKNLLQTLTDAKEDIMKNFESLHYSQAIRKIINLADMVNKYIDTKQPWATVKDDLETTRATLTAVINCVKVLNIYLKPVIPVFAEKIENILNTGELTFANVESKLEDHKINKFDRLIERIEKEKVEAMVEESKQEQIEVTETPKVELEEPLAPECTFDDFMKVDLRVARVAVAENVEGADKLLRLELDLNGITKQVFAGISKAYKPEDLVDRLVVCVANLAPRKMRFGMSEGMVVAAGPGGEEIFVLSPDSGAKPGQRVH